ncbi:PilW family protein [Xenophilus azovorans]|uniref:PilW family protein n=1 Tax=Xenophilus azovorans TaxID=151755 RepID=UPI00068BFC98|nr:PilW family protein [Xenophilus azovorans]
MSRPSSRRQAGVSLVELLVGIAIGLLVVLAAVGTLIVSRGATRTTADVSALQQQASYALRIIGLQLRQAGSLELNPTADKTAMTFTDFTGTVVSGSDGAGTGPDVLAVGSQPSLTLEAGQRDCIGDTSTTAVSSRFTLNDKGELTCKGTSSPIAQPVIANVADFQVAYRVNTGTTDAPEIRTYTATDMNAVPARWARVSAIEICLDLIGEEAVPDTGATYADCQGATPARGTRTHLVFRNVFAVRRQPFFEVAL